MRRDGRQHGGDVVGGWRERQAVGVTQLANPDPTTLVGDAPTRRCPAGSDRPLEEPARGNRVARCRHVRIGLSGHTQPSRTTRPWRWTSSRSGCWAKFEDQEVRDGRRQMYGSHSGYRTIRVVPGNLYIARFRHSRDLAEFRDSTCMANVGLSHVDETTGQDRPKVPLRKETLARREPDRQSRGGHLRQRLGGRSAVASGVLPPTWVYRRTRRRVGPPSKS